MADSPRPFLLGRVTLIVELAPDGTRLFGMNINTSDDDRYEPTKLYDIQAMLGQAHTNLADPDWLARAYGDEEPSDE